VAIGRQAVMGPEGVPPSRVTPCRAGVVMGRCRRSAKIAARGHGPAGATTFDIRRPRRGHGQMEIRPV